ncbi:dienelactone hydrolase family protein [Paenibacillus sp. Root444D2]|uniref:dienelactone hydrolase family protein n=1 Tax=Paenibacillus sp. Root444D2 TaxID=1736538 RepID=UPI00070E8C7C|nr:alpha/beta hydrolase family protein [Paenibacillus sp. Root444D2]KQX68645.1 dienelactone hydrolase [Paenibacillus sp. Root444D2]
MWNPDDYLELVYNNLNDESRLAIKKPWNERKADVRSKLLESLGEIPNTTGELNPVVLERMDKGDHYLERVIYTTDINLQVAAFVLSPKRLMGKAPTVLAWHGHGYGSREIVGLKPDGTTDDAPPGIHQHFALKLVQRGMIVVAPEIIGFGDRRLSADKDKDPKKSSSCFSLASRLLLYGKTLAGLRIYEAIRSLDYLLMREDVDPNRIGCMGFSGGGLIASLSSALDERIKATVICAFTSTFRGSLLAMNHCIDNYLPSILPYADLPELIGLIAPRALFVESGIEDPLFPVASVQEAIVKLKEIYYTEGTEGKFEVDLFPGKHEVSGRQSYDWLARQLKA